MKNRRTLVSLLAGLALFAASCGGGTDSETTSSVDFVEQGAQSVDTSEITTTTVVGAGPAGASEGDGGDSDGGDSEGAGETGDIEEGDATATTLPQNEQSDSENIDDLFTAMRTFNSCLEDEGTAFIGAPSSELPDDDPRNDAGYLESLGKCASVSQIQEAFAAADLGSEGKSPEEIEERNRGLIGFTDCLKGRGWNPAPMEPDENGLLQVGDLGAPEGEDIFSSDDMDDCRRIGQADAEEQAAAEG